MLLGKGAGEVETRWRPLPSVSRFLSSSERRQSKEMVERFITEQKTHAQIECRLLRRETHCPGFWLASYRQTLVEGRIIHDWEDVQEWILSCISFSVLI
jgi:hypothetical protein